MNDKSRTVSAVGLALLVGILALPFVFSDPSLDESVAQRVVIIAGIFLVGGAFVGWMAGRRWPVSVLCAWTPFGMGLVMLFGKVTAEGHVPYWSTIGAFLLGPIALAVLGGYAGFRLVGRIAKR